MKSLVAQREEQTLDKESLNHSYGCQRFVNDRKS